MGKHFITLPDNQIICCRIENENSQDDQVFVFVHGNFSSFGWWNETIDGLLHTNKKIIAMDMKGFGQSTYINEGKRLKDYAQNVIDLLNALKINKAILIGWSFGGTVCQKICQMAPHLATKLILTCSVSHEGLPFYDSQGKPLKTSQQILKNPKVSATYAVLQTKNRQTMRNIYDLVLFAKMESASEERKNELAEDPFKQRNYLHLMQSLANSDIKIDAIKTPTLIIHGSQDLVIPVQTIIGTANKLGKMELWEGHGHMIPIEDTKRFIESIKKFI